MIRRVPQKRDKLGLIKSISWNGQKYKIIVASNINLIPNARHDSKCFASYFNHTRSLNRYYCLHFKDKEQYFGRWWSWDLNTISAISNVKIGREFLAEIVCAKARNVKIVSSENHKYFDMTWKENCRKLYSLFSPHK